MKKQITLQYFFITVFTLQIINISYAQKLPNDKEVIKQMTKVADWQLTQKWSETKSAMPNRVVTPNVWEAGAFYPGILEIYRVTKNEKYLDTVKSITVQNDYKGGNQLRNGDHQAIFQSYLELYEIDKNPLYLTAAKNTLDSIMANPKNGALEYSWCDLLFMAPPIWAKYAAITNEQNYLDFQDKIYWEAVTNLQDTATHLFYRDNRFKTLKSASGNPIFGQEAMVG
jgi:unsaturated rhamnogalacturonyl hydrolase